MTNPPSTEHHDRIAAARAEAIAKTTPMDAADLQPCAICGKGMMHDHGLLFYEVTIGQCVVDVLNVQRMHGMEMMLGRAAPLAGVFSPDNTVARRLPPKRVLVCMHCGLESGHPLAMLLEEPARG